MIAYNRTWIESQRIIAESKKWSARKIISDEQQRAIAAAYATPLYTPGVFIRVTLFIFTMIALNGVFGLVMLNYRGPRGIDSLITGAACIAALEIFIKAKQIYHAGIDDALLYTGAAHIIIGWSAMFHLTTTISFDHQCIYWLMALPVLLCGAIRYRDRLMTAAVFVCGLGAIIAAIVFENISAVIWIPFVAIAYASFIYVLVLRVKHSAALQPWRECVSILELLAVAAFYIGGNYYVAKWAGAIAAGVMNPDDIEIPFAFFFIALTAITPIAYIAKGIFSRDYLMLRSGLIAAVLSLLTLRYYVQVVPQDVALMVAGSLLLLIAFAVARYLKADRNGFTASKNLLDDEKGLARVSLLIGLSVSAATTQTDTPFSGDGGAFGGAGSSEQW